MSALVGGFDSEHEILGTGGMTRIFVEGTRDGGNIHHQYQIRDADNFYVLGVIDFNNGFKSPKGANGVFVEDLLRICKDYLRQYPDPDQDQLSVDNALAHIEDALNHLESGGR